MINNNLIENIVKKDYESAKADFEEVMLEKVDSRLYEMKRALSAQIYEETDELPFTPDKKKSTPWTSARRKAKNLARNAIKRFQGSGKPNKVDDPRTTRAETQRAPVKGFPIKRYQGKKKSK